MLPPMNLRIPTDQDIHSAFEKGEAAVRDLFRQVAVQVEELARQLAQQGEALHALFVGLAQLASKFDARRWDSFAIPSERRAK